MRTAAATLAALLTLITLASYWGWAGWTGGKFSIVIGNGGVCIGTGVLSGEEGGFGPPGWTLEMFKDPTPGAFARAALTGFHWDSYPAEWHIHTSTPFWPLIALTLIMFFWSHHTLRRRSQPNACPNCRYPRTGLPPTAPCPECGTPTTP